MHLTDYNYHLSKYISQQRSLLDQLANYQIFPFQTLSISCKDITSSGYWSQCKKDLEAIIGDKKSVIYYFKINPPFNAGEIQRIVTSMKKTPGKSNPALPKVNEKNLCEKNDILYVGKTDKNFPGRLKQHLGLVASKTTYALHLNTWATELDLTLNVMPYTWPTELNLTLNVMPCNLKLEENKMLEQIESVFHFALRPLLGRSGH
ncbi:MAG TPA: GIY-YIG nuclease family protein [Mucilaginibacter sp.]